MRGKISLEAVNPEEMEILLFIFKQELKKTKEFDISKERQRKTKFIEFKLKFYKGPYEVLFSNDEIKFILEVLSKYHENKDIQELKCKIEQIYY